MGRKPASVRRLQYGQRGRTRERRYDRPSITGGGCGAFRFFGRRGVWKRKKGTPKSLLVCGLFLVLCGRTQKPGVLLRVDRIVMWGSRHGGDVYC